MPHRMLPCLCVLALLLSACSAKPDIPAPVPAPATPKAANEKPKPIPAPSAPVLDIGDVESYLHYSIVPVPESASDFVKIDIVENKISGINMVTVDMRPPYPKEFWIDCTVKANRTFKTQPILIQGSVIREQDIIGEVTGVMGIDQVLSTTTSATTRMDAFFGLGNLEGSILIHGEAEALLMPEGTNAETLDVEGIELNPKAKTMLLSNPLRINFLKE